MGTSKRYANSIDAQMDARVAEGIMRTGSPDTLNPKQLDLDKEPVTKPPRARPARAWVRYGEHGIEIDVEVVAWTERAVAIRWAGPDASEHRAWVWSGAAPQRRGRRASG